MNDLKISAEAAEQRRKYKREWRAKNRERVREYNRRYWEKRALQHAKKEQQTIQEVV